MALSVHVTLFGMVAIALLSPRPAIAQTVLSADAVAVVLAEHRQARDLIQNLHCQFKYDTALVVDPGDPPTAYHYTGEYWHSRDAVRLKVTVAGDKSYEYVWKDGLRTFRLSRLDGGNAQSSASKSGLSRRYLDRCDAWALAQLAVNVPERMEYLPLEDLVKLATRLERAWTTTEGRRTLTTLRLHFEPNQDQKQEWRVDVVLDSDLNNLVRKTTHYVGSTPEGSQFRREEVVTVVAEVKKGVFVPRVIKGRSGVGEKLDRSDNTAELSDIRLDQPFGPATFVLKLPNGIHLVDATKGVAYTVDRDGKQTSKSMALGQFPPPPLADAVRSDAQPTASVVEESSHMTAYLLAGAVALAGAAGFVAWRQRWA